MIFHTTADDRTLRALIRKNEIRFGGNNKLKIYGHLHCKSGKRMNRQNRVFFTDEKDALSAGFRPCGNCMKTAYKNWKNGLI